MLESQCEAEPLLVGSDNFEILRGISKALITSEKFGFGFDQKIGSAQLWLHNPHPHPYFNFSIVMSILNKQKTTGTGTHYAGKTTQKLKAV